MKSIMEPPKHKICWECGEFAREEHHIFYGTANRKWSEKYGLKVHLCVRCHRDEEAGVHGRNKELDQRLKEAGQRAFEETHGSRMEFIKIFGRNYLPEGR